MHLSNDAVEGTGREAGLGIHRRLLAGLLCEMDGVTGNDGVLTLATTSSNALASIDAALLRQGRLETLIHVLPLSYSAAHAMCGAFFRPFTPNPISPTPIQPLSASFDRS
uniref:ATP-dependent zinc metalloprotease FtsH n=1 Tax=Lygus hesperus TaxID=30085 RepID=A0A0A9WXD8_LYGHE